MAQQELAIDLKSLSNTHKRIYETQEHFLKMYAKSGTILGAARATGISRPTVFNIDGERRGRRVVPLFGGTGLFILESHRPSQN